MNTTILQCLFRWRVFDVVHALWPHRLTVLSYHRIDDPTVPGFDTLKANVSATPAAFAEQMDFVRKRFEIVSVENILAWLRGDQALPDNPLLITFDDGYRDNLDHALPILRERRLPAVIFLATDYIGRDTPFLWDIVAYCFFRTPRKEACLPLLGKKKWHDERSRTTIMKNWLNMTKTLADDEKRQSVGKLSRALGVPAPEKTNTGKHLTWEQVRTMTSEGIDIGAHTQGHPILTGIPLEQVEREARGSKERIEKEIGRPVKVFAYPNGAPSDFNPAIEAVLKKVGFEAAFALTPGPSRLAETQREPMAIRRIAVHSKDTLPRFAAKLVGMSRLFG
jgi:peptidoglycan/xylan/chitin deacetylase (PgdA/CDA1 family)